MDIFDLLAICFAIPVLIFAGWFGWQWGDRDRRATALREWKEKRQ